MLPQVGAGGGTPRPSLLVDFEAHAPGRAPDGRALERPYWSAHYDFHLQPATSNALP